MSNMAKEVWCVQTSLMNGTVTMATISDIFYDKELAEETKNAIIEKNKKNGVTVWCNIQKATIFENREDVPILNQE